MIENRPVDSIYDLSPQLANLRAYWLGWGSNDAVDGEVPIYGTGLPHPLLNGVLRLRDRSVADAVKLAGERLGQAPHLWWAGPDSDAGVADEILAHGGKLDSTLPVMAIDLHRLADIGGPDGLVIEQVTDRRTMTDYVDTYSDVFRVPGEVMPQMVDAEFGYSAHYSDVVRFVGQLDGKAVGTSALSVSHGVAGIYWVATRKDYRGRGVGSALTAAALVVARERGLRVGTLQASGLGEPIYRALGFQTIAHTRHFTLPVS